MDVFSLNKTGGQGRVVNGFDDLVWTERYAKPGEFKMTSADLTLMDRLPIGSYISHFDTLELMEVLDYTIEKKRGKTTKLSVTGATFDTALEGRIVIPNLGGARVRATDEVNQLVLPAANSYAQAKTLIDMFLTGLSGPTVAGDHVTFVRCLNEVVGNEAEQLSRVIDRGQLNTRVEELLAVSDCGLKSRRPSGNRTTIDIVVYKGRDVSDKVTLSAKMDELEEATYFISKRKDKNAVFVCGKYDGYPVIYGSPTPVGLERRWIYVAAEDIEDNTDPTAYGEQFKARADEARGSNKMIELTHTKTSEETAARYGKDYSMGDLVGLAADFGVHTKMRVDEFVWSFDKDGVSGYPTLAPID